MSILQTLEWALGEESILKSSDHNYYNDLRKVLEPQVHCHEPNSILLLYGDTAVLSLIILFVLLGLVKFCHFQFS